MRKSLRLLAHGGVVGSVILAFDLLDNSLHLLDLALPFLLSHLGLPSEKLLVGLAIASTQTVPEGSELSIVVVEI